MLMLVVTIIIAAVVSAFAGGLVGGQQKAPSLTMDIKITTRDNMQRVVLLRQSSHFFESDPNRNSN